MIILDYRDRRPIYEQVISRFQELMLTGALEKEDVYKIQVPALLKSQLIPGSGHSPDGTASGVPDMAMRRTRSTVSWPAPE